MQWIAVPQTSARACRISTRIFYRAMRAKDTPRKDGRKSINLGSTVRREFGCHPRVKMTDGGSVRDALMTRTCPTLLAGCKTSAIMDIALPPSLGHSARSRDGGYTPTSKRRKRLLAQRHGTNIPITITRGNVPSAARGTSPPLLP